MKIRDIGIDLRQVAKDTPCASGHSTVAVVIGTAIIKAAYVLGDCIIQALGSDEGEGRGGG